MNDFKNASLRFVVFIILLSGSLTSLHLTAKFCQELGEASGVGLTFKVIGITLEISKIFLPMIAVTLFYRGKYLFTSIAGGMAGLLIALSILASVSALNGSINSAKQLQDDIRKIETDIANKNAELLVLSNKGVVTATKPLRDDLKVKEAELKSLKEQVKNNASSSNEVLLKYGDYVSISLAVFLELINVSMSLLFAALRVTPAIQQAYTKQVYSPVNTHVEQYIEPTLLAHNNVIPLRFNDNVNTQNDDINTVRKAVITGSVKPSHRGIKKHFKVSQQDITNLLNDLHYQGILNKSGNGFELA